MRLKYRIVSALAAATVASAMAFSSASAAGTVHVWDGNGHSYELVTSAATWVDANAAAQGRSWGEPGMCNGHLATVTSVEENAFLAQAFSAATLQFKWFGGIQPIPSDVGAGWTWSNGEHWDYTDWYPGEPTNSTYPNHDPEDATVFWTGGHWNDAPRTWTYGASGGYVVEYDCLGISVDVKPGSAENTVNGNNSGVIPIAILTTPSFDAATVDPTSVTMNGAAVKMRGKSMTAGALEDADADGDLDLVVQVVDADGVFVNGSTTATITAQTYAGITVKGLDTITYVP